jgi:hypothetical protein
MAFRAAVFAYQALGFEEGDSFRLLSLFPDNDDSLSSAHSFTPGRAPNVSRMKLCLTHRENQLLAAE